MFRRKKKKFLNLPQLTKKEFTPEKVAELLKSGIPVLCRLNAGEKYNINALMNLNANTGLNSFLMFRKEEDFLVKYIIDQVKEDNVVYFKPRAYYMLNNSNIMTLYNSELYDSCEVYYDEQGITAECMVYVHDISENEIRECLKHDRVMYVNEERFLKKN